jgi:pimeloyl-ACP methyl ester carboxylesterase
VIAIEAAGDGEPLVLLHGVGANRSIWQHAAPQLARTRLVLAPDLPGFGESPPVADGFDLNLTADAVADAIVARAAPPFDLVGNSLGGAIAAVLASRRPELVRRLVLVAPAGFNTDLRLLSDVAGHIGGSVTTVRRLIGTPFVANGAARRVLLWGSVAAPERMAPSDARTMLQGSRGSSRIDAAIASVLRADLRDDLAESKVPLGLIWGEHDRVVPIAALAAIRAVRPDAIAETIPDAAHVPQIERPAEFVDVLQRILERLGRSEPKP